MSAGILHNARIEDNNMENVKETKRLILRKFRPDDAADVFEYLAEPDVNCFRDMRAESVRRAREVIEKRISDEKEEYLAICLKETGKVIGEVFSCAEEHAEDTFSPCWMLNPKFRGKGYAYEAVEAYFDHLFYDRAARRIYIYTEDYNVPCQKLCEKLGMRREGLFIELISFVNDPDGSPKYENTYQYAVLKREWEQRRAERHSNAARGTV